MLSPPSHTPRRAPRRHSRARLAAFRTVEASCAALGGRAFYRRSHLRGVRLVERHERVEVADLPEEWADFTVVQISDLHGGAFLGRGDLAAVVDRVAAHEPDLVAITGDWITHRWDDAVPLLDDLARLRAPCGVLAVFGNHDYRGRLEGRIAEAAAERGIRILRDECVRFERGTSALAVVGLEDLEEARELDLVRARRDVRATDVEIVLCHNPLAARRLAREQCALILSGHSHGGQIDLPWLRTLGPAHPGLRLGLGATTLLVSRGLGVVGLPLRVGAPAEIVVVHLVARRGLAGRGGGASHEERVCSAP